MRASTVYFTLAGALGGAIGFGLMELVRGLLGATAGSSGSLTFSGWQFAAFGLAVGGALGATEGLYFRNNVVLLRGLLLGGFLGLLGGFLGGVFGQWIFNRVPMEYVSKSTADIAIVLDSSGSMKAFIFGGNDPWGQRHKASKQLIDRLSTNDRVAVVDFDDVGRLALPLTRLADDAARKQAKDAVDSIDSSGGTNLDAGLQVAIEELQRSRESGRSQTILFLTDGVGTYSPSTAESARRSGITIHTVGLGSEVDSQMLEGIASTTEGRYFAVGQASDLIATFERIRKESLGNMADQRRQGADQGATDEEQRTSPIWLWLVRLASWGAMGLLLGLGQGLRDNSWQDLRSCALGGMLGGVVGGVLIEAFQLGLTGASGLYSRALADILVGALIGGSLRWIKNAAEARMLAARIEKRAIIGGLSAGQGAPGRGLSGW